MELNQLRYLVAVAEHRSITAAARSLRASQPTLSVALRTLEDEFGTTLLHRNSRGATLTEAGVALREAADLVFEVLERAQSRIRDLEDEDVGAFVVGCNEALGSYFLPAFLSDFLEHSPRIEVSLWNGTSSDVRDAVVGRRVDFGIVVNPESHPDLVIVHLFEDAIELYVCSADPARTRAEALERLRIGPLIACKRIGAVRALVHRFEADGVLPARVIDCGDLQLVRRLALDGIGVALLPRRVALNPGGELVPLHKGLPGFRDRICLLYRGDLQRTRAALKLKDGLAGHGRSLSGNDPNEDSVVPP